jgi:hypothetical protein
VFSSHPPNRVPLGAIIGAFKVLPDSLRIPIPHGLVTKISVLRSPSKSANKSNRLSAVFSSHPPNRVPLGAIIGAFKVLPDSLRIPIPHGLVTKISARPSPSKSLLMPAINYVHDIFSLYLRRMATEEVKILAINFEKGTEKIEIILMSS